MAALSGLLSGTKQFLPFCLAWTDPLAAEDGHRESETFSKTGACCPGHEAGCFSVKALLMLTVNKVQLEGGFPSYRRNQLL